MATQEYAISLAVNFSPKHLVSTLSGVYSNNWFPPGSFISVYCFIRYPQLALAIRGLVNLGKLAARKISVFGLIKGTRPRAYHLEPNQGRWGSYCPKEASNRQPLDSEYSDHSATCYLSAAVSGFNSLRRCMILLLSISSRTAQSGYPCFRDFMSSPTCVSCFP